MPLRLEADAPYSSAGKVRWLGSVVKTRVTRLSPANWGPAIVDEWIEEQLLLDPIRATLICFS